MAFHTSYFQTEFYREDVWPMTLKRFDYIEDHFKEIDFHNDKLALWADLRSTPDNNLHGDGVVVGRSQDGVRLVVDVARTRFYNC